MKKLLAILVLGLLLSGCSENKSEANRKQSAIKLSCEIKKVNIIKKFDGTDTDIWYDEKTFLWVKAAFEKTGYWEYRIKTFK